MEKRVLVAVVLSFLVLYLYQAFLVPPPKKVPERAGAASGPMAAGREAPAVAKPEALAAAPVEAAAVGAPVPVAAASALVGETMERRVVVETRAVRAVFSNRGAHLDSWLLKRYLDDLKKPVDLVPTRLAAGSPHPFMVKLDSDARSSQVNGALFRVVGDPGDRIDGTRGPVRLAFEYQDAAGLTVRKSFELDPDSYLIKFTTEAASSGLPLNVGVVWGPGLGDAEKGVSTQYVQKPQGILLQGTSVLRLDPKSVLSQPVHEGVFGFGGVDDHYFIAAALLGKTSSRLEFETVVMPDPEVKEGRQFTAFTLNPSGEAASGTVFFGPKDFDVLRKANPDLVRVINFGFFSFLAVPLLRALKSINGYVGNFGWSIIALTVFINAAIFPLRHKSVVSMRKLQDLQPEIKAIQDRYGKLKATDPARQKLNQETMSLYKERGVNPASGCVPMLLTIPVLFAFYSLLSQAIELRGAPFAFWIRDLSIHDPLYVTPILMGITMVVQQKMTPSTMDPVQQKMMMLMPVVFTFMFLWAPSGLVIYWFVSNLLAIAQQYFTNRIIGPGKSVGVGAGLRSVKTSSGR